MAPFLKTLLLASLFSISSCLARALEPPQLSLQQSDFPPPDLPYTFRQATYTDINDITDVIIDAFSPSPEWTYNYQFKDKHPAYHRECFRQALASQWKRLEKHKSSIIMNVIAVPITEETRSSRIVAIGLWQIMPPLSSDSEAPINHNNTLFPFISIPTLTTPSESDADTNTIIPLSSGHPVVAWPNCSRHLDANITRATDFAAQCDALKHKYIDTAYPDGQVYLALLATHPDYDGHNFGARHCRWGMELAAKRGKGEPVTLTATPAGYPLYKSLGFESVKNVTLEFLDGLGSSWTEVMRWRY